MLVAFSTSQSFAETPVSSNPPTDYQRGMYVGDCDYLIDEIHANNDVLDFVSSGTSATPKANALLNYCIDNHISYIAVYKLASSNNIISPGLPVLANKPYYPAVWDFLLNFHEQGIKIGLVFSSSKFSEDYILPYLEQNCLPIGCAVPICPGLERAYFHPNGIPEEWITPEENESSYDIIERADYVRQILNYAEYANSTIADKGFEAEGIYYQFDWLSLEFEFWDKDAYDNKDSNGVYDYPPEPNPLGGTSTPALVMYQRFKEITEVLNDVSLWFCNIPLEMELKFDMQNNNLYNDLINLGYSSPYYYQPESNDIAAYIDGIFDRFLYVSPTSNPTALFDRSCEAFYHLGLTTGNSDHSRIWPPAYASRAQTSSQPYIPKNVWGDTIGNGNYEAAGYYNYLNNNGNSGPQVNYMNGPEGGFKTELNNVPTTYQCSDCITNAYPTISQVYNQFSLGNYDVGDAYSDGVMWFCYGLLDHPRHPYVFYRALDKDFNEGAVTEGSNFASPVPCDQSLEIKASIEMGLTYKIIDMQGRAQVVPLDGNKISTSALRSSVYTLIAIDSNGKTHQQKIIVNHLK